MRWVKVADRALRQVAAVVDAMTDPEPCPEDPTQEDWPPFDEWELKNREGDISRYWNSRYSVTVQRKKQHLMRHKVCVCLNITNADQSAKHDWRDFQRIKNEILGPEWEGIELYPAESRMVDPSNSYLMYCFRDKLPIGINVRMVFGSEEEGAEAPQRPIEGDRVFKGPPVHQDSGR